MSQLTNNLLECIGNTPLYQVGVFINQNSPEYPVLTLNDQYHW